jgi:hypothetical protein
MLPHMVRVMPHLTKTYQIRRVRVSVPMIPQLVDGVRYFGADDALPPVGVGRPRTQPPASAPPRPDWTSLCEARDFAELERLLVEQEAT